MASFKVGNYFAPTPVHIRRLGDSLLAISGMNTIGSAIAYVNAEDPKVKKILLIIAVSMQIIGIIGKFLSNFFKDDEINQV